MKTVARLDVVSGLVLLSEQTVLLQIESRKVAEIRAGIDKPKVGTLAIDIRSGTGSRLDEGWPRFVAANSRHLVTYQSHPFPQLTIWTWARP